MLRNPWETETRCKWTEEIIAQSMCRRITVKDECFQVCFKHRNKRYKEKEVPRGSNLNEWGGISFSTSSLAVSHLLHLTSRRQKRSLPLN